MKKLNLVRYMGLTCVGIALILVILGSLMRVTTLSIVAYVLLLICIVGKLILFRCPYCGKYLGGRYGNAIREENGTHICPHCNRNLEKTTT